MNEMEVVRIVEGEREIDGERERMLFFKEGTRGGRGRVAKDIWAVCVPDVGYGEVELETWSRTYWGSYPVVRWLKMW